MMYSGVAIASYLLLFVYLILGMSVRNGLILLLAVSLCFIFVSWSPFLSQTWSMGLVTALNATFAFFLLLLSPWLKMNIHIEENKIVDLIIVVFLVASLALQMPGIKSEAALQIGSFTFALYFAVSQNLFRKLCLASVVVIGGGRAIIAGAVYGFAMNHSHKLHMILSMILLVLIATMAILGVLFVYLEEYLLTLRDQDIFMKGRTGFWLSLLETNATLLGNGAGASIQSLFFLTESYHLPHNDYLRIYVDYGLILFILILYSLWKNSLRGSHQLFATSVLAVYLLTGNPLSFPTVIISYLLVLNSQPIRIMRRP